MSGAELIGMWAFQLPNFVLAALMYTLLGRFVLSFIFKPDSDMVFWRVFKQITDPFIAVVRQVTPALVSDRLVILLAFAWVLCVRIALVVVFFLT